MYSISCDATEKTWAVDLQFAFYVYFNKLKTKKGVGTATLELDKLKWWHFTGSSNED